MIIALDLGYLATDWANCSVNTFPEIFPKIVTDVNQHYHPSARVGRLYAMRLTLLPFTVDSLPGAISIPRGSWMLLVLLPSNPCFMVSNCQRRDLGVDAKAKWPPVMKFSGVRSTFWSFGCSHSRNALSMNVVPHSSPNER